ncbi:hypothetical protein HRH25_08055 [Flavisolibacter sp. BT320]|nr:hypothetical protein [Flavisolibacter longurius]
MQHIASDLVLLFGFQLRSFRERTTCGILLAFVLILWVYFLDVLLMLVQPNAAIAGETIKLRTHTSTTALPTTYHDKSKPLATITTSVYEAKIHWAIPYIPSSPDELLVQAAPGNRFVVLDMSYRNITTDKEADMGWVTLTTVIRDERGREYFSEPLAIASLQREYAFPGHENQYRRMRGKLKPGEVVRTTIIGFEAPASIDNFILYMEDGESQKHTVHEASFRVR